MTKSFQLTLAAFAALLAAVGLTLLHLKNQRLHRRVAADAARIAQVARLREENARLEQLLAAPHGGSDSSRSLVRRQIEELRTAIARQEQTAAQQHAARMAVTSRDAAEIETNRDPHAGLTRLEHFQNRGQATPVDAFETLVWASLQGDEATLANITALNSATRAKAEVLIAELSPEDRAQWTPQKLGQLWFSGLFTELSALQIVGETTVNADETVVRIRLANRGGEEKLTVRRTPVGWKVLAPSAAIDHLAKKLSPTK